MGRREIIGKLQRKYEHDFWMLFYGNGNQQYCFNGEYACCSVLCLDS